MSSEDNSEEQSGGSRDGARGLFASPGRAAALVVLAILIIIRALDPAVVQSLRLRGFDFLEELAPRRYQPIAVKIVTIDDKSLAQYGQWPWSRARVAQLVDKIAAGKPSVLGVDIIFAEPDRLSPGRLIDSDPEIPAATGRASSRICRRMKLCSLTRCAKSRRCWRSAPSNEAARPRDTLARHDGSRIGRAIHARFYSLIRNLCAACPRLRRRSAGYGSVDQEPDHDGVIRRVPLFIVGRRPPGAEPRARNAAGSIRRGCAGDTSLERRVCKAPGSASIFCRPMAAAVSTRISRRRTTLATSRPPTCSTDPTIRRSLNGAAVLLGSSALGLTEQDQTPLGLMPGIEVWAQSLESMVTGNLLRRPGFLELIELAMVLVGGTGHNLCAAVRESADGGGAVSRHRCDSLRLGVSEFQILEAPARRDLSRDVVGAGVRRHVVGELARRRGWPPPARLRACNTNAKWKRASTVN